MTKSISAIIINSPLSDGLGLDFAVECADKKFYAVLIFSKDGFFSQITEKVSPFGIFTLPVKTDSDTLIQTLLVLVSTAKKLRSLKDKSESQLSKMQELQMISRAKMILISSFKMSEEQAHKYIEKRAMESRKTRKAIAESIINSYGN